MVRTLHDLQIDAIDEQLNNKKDFADKKFGQHVSLIPDVSLQDDDQANR